MKPLSPYQSVVFDLDGTLIDSAPGILASFASVLERAGIAPAVPLDDSVIGPPLRQTLMIISGLPDGADLDRLALDFREVYDTEGYLTTLSYPGVDEMLCELAAHRIPLAIATNKRRVPTLKILDHLGWGGYFRLVGTLDTPGSQHADKASLIKSVLADTGARGPSSPYIGDKWEDGEAASANGMPFFAASWGYGAWDRATMQAPWGLVHAPGELALILTGALSA
jgi:phosphoglycolate phosphatase